MKMQCCCQCLCVWLGGQFEHSTSERGVDADLWLAYCAFHLGDYKRALKVGNTAKSLLLARGHFCFGR